MGFWESAGSQGLDVEAFSNTARLRGLAAVGGGGRESLLAMFSLEL